MKYELALLVNAKYDTYEVENTIRELVYKLGGKVSHEKTEEKRHLAYSIEGQEIADYYYADIEFDSVEKATELVETLNVEDYDLRYLLVKADRQ